MKSQAQRMSDVAEAALALPLALAAAMAEPLQHADGTASHDAQVLWAEVERLGAIIHRQGRLLAGKPRGG